MDSPNPALQMKELGEEANDRKVGDQNVGKSTGQPLDATTTPSIGTLMSTQGNPGVTANWLEVKKFHLTQNITGQNNNNCKDGKDDEEAQRNKIKSGETPLPGADKIGTKKPSQSASHRHKLLIVTVVLLLMILAMLIVYIIMLRLHENDDEYSWNFNSTTSPSPSSE